MLRNETLARSMLPNKFTQRGRLCHSFLYMCEPLTSKRKRQKRAKNEENCKVGLRDSYQIPKRAFQCCVLLLWAAKSLSTRSDIPAKSASFACQNGYTQPKEVEETLALLEQELSTNKIYILDKILTYLNNYMLAENEMNRQQ